MDHLVVLIIESLGGYFLGAYWYLLVVKFLTLYLEMYKDSHLGLMLEPGWGLDMDTFVVLMMESFRDYLLDTHWDLFMVN